ncbi:HPr kinase/phosphorylase [Phenylobacterium sp.]|jgi:serine kinase of HPr protein (carbohydrate metabolism regulator)|uniref:HPr kinase/phosphorylase n=1 Tax=Phenylobacterium sp. TaxID=1871053 RepID=UPI0035B37207
MIAHAGLIARRLEGVWKGVLIVGASGAGKSDLTLRALGEGFRLVADDRVVVWASGGTLYGRAPETLAGLIEARGVGIQVEPAINFCRIALSVRCGPYERMPEPDFEEYAGLSIPTISIEPFEASAPAKLGRALQHLGAGAEGAYQDALAAPPRPGGDSR